MSFVLATPFETVKLARKESKGVFASGPWRQPVRIFVPTLFTMASISMPRTAPLAKLKAPARP
jgi:hypothetical protein